MYVAVLLLTDLLIFLLLRQINSVLAIFFLVLAIISVPALVIHRREAANAPEIGPESESMGFGVLRLAGSLGLDATGVALAVLLITLFALALRAISTGAIHG